MSKEKVEKINFLRNLLVNHSHKLDIIVGTLLIIYSIYGYFNNIQYYWIAAIAGIISIIMAIVKPVKIFNNYLNKKIIKKG